MNKLSQANKILVTNLMHIGDIVFITPFLHVLRKHAPHADITILVDKKTQDIVQHNPNINNIITIDKKGKDDNLKALWLIAAKLRTHSFDLTINLHPNERCSFLAAFSGAKQKVGVSAPLFRWLFGETYPFRLKEKDVLVVDAYLDILHQMGITDLAHNGVEKFLSPKEITFAKEFYAANEVGENDKLIGLNVGGSWATKLWTTEGWAALADHYLKQGIKPVFFGGPMDIPMVEEILAKMQGTPILATGRTSLLQLAALISSCNVFVSGDSGPMHIASTQKVPIVAIYGPSDWSKFPPFTDKKQIITAGLNCQPCNKHVCEHHSCMKQIDVKVMIEAVNRLLGNSFISKNRFI